MPLKIVECLYNSKRTNYKKKNISDCIQNKILVRRKLIFHIIHFTYTEVISTKPGGKALILKIILAHIIEHGEVELVHN